MLPSAPSPGENELPDYGRVFSPPPPSPWRLTGRSILDALIGLFAANLIGAVPMILAMMLLFSGRYSVTAKQTQVFDSMPKTDTRLEEWIRKQPGVESVAVKRTDDQLVIRTRSKDAFRLLSPPWEKMGYTPSGQQSIMTEYLDRMESITSFPPMLLGSALASSAGFFLVAFWRRKWLRSRGEPVLPWRSREPVRQAWVGVAFGLGMVGFGILYSVVIQKFFPAAAVEGPFAVVREWGWGPRIGVLLAGAVGAPIAEEMFFRGTLYGSFAAIGRSGLGLWVSSLLFMVMHYSDPANLAAIFVVGAALAWLYQRSGSLVAPITAHAVNNALNFILLFMGLGS